MNPNKKAIIVVLVIVAALLAIVMFARYGKNTITKQKPTSIQPNKPGEQPAPERPKEISLKSDNGEGSLNYSAEGKAKISETFPDDVFVYEDAKVTFMAEKMSATDLYTVVYITEAKLNAAVDKYKQEMEKSGWEKKDEIDVPSTGAKVLTFMKNQRMTSVLIGTSQEKESTGKTQIQVGETKLPN